MKTKFFASFFIAAVLLASCTDSTTSPAKIGVTMKATSATSTLSKSGRTAGTGFIFTDVLLGVTELEFETLEENSQEDQNGESENEDVEYKGQFIIDLINGTSTPDFGVAGIVPGIYSEIEIDVEPILPNGKSVFIAFKIPQLGGDTLRVEYSTSEKIELEIEREAGFQLGEGALNQVLVLLNLDLLFDGIDFTLASVDSDGVIRINAGSNTDLAALIGQRLEDACEAGEDNNDDGEIDN